MNNNAIIYEPDFIILNNELLTSLCVYFDELILISNKNIEDELNQIIEEKKENYTQKEQYIKNILRPLSQEGIVTLYDGEEVTRICPISSQIDIGEFDIRMENGKAILDISAMADNEMARAIVEKVLNHCTVSDLMRFISAYTLSMEYNIPIIRDEVNNSQYRAQSLADLFATKILCKLAVPKLNATSPENIIKIRGELKDELIEFRAGVLDMTYLLYQSIRSTPNDVRDINREIEMLIDTKVKSAVMSLEYKIKSNRKKCFSNIVIEGGKFLISGALLKLGLGNTVSTLNNSAALLQSFSDMRDITNKPEDRIASYIVSLRDRV